MAVTLTAENLRDRLRLGDTAEETAEATYLLAYCTEAATNYAPAAPDAVHDAAAINIARYIFDQPTAGRAAAYANAMRNSGARAMLSPYRRRRAGNVMLASSEIG